LVSILFAHEHLHKIPLDIFMKGILL
jgi:hypothetical protein